ncbi:hypothetical protein U0035_20740 [Niabella yanshanensis]|uniref:Uncharacterized protein n=1 Tax=Niabella yanshanensis TaxID=577386 RepID=A0ABZ0W6C7_9BACT|nr:hypothetical protein [Niabella yanshanensis]WQD38099.1 hypothetical protein U0035_20740 [Niabella yanshanensis]
MTRFVNYYNARSSDKICSLFPPPKNEEENCFWNSLKPDEEKSIYDEFGAIKKYEYLGVDTTDPEKVIVFKVLFANKGVKALSFNTKDQKFKNFRFDTSSDLIEKMLKQR